jgi:hypothetical protein
MTDPQLQEMFQEFKDADIRAYEEELARLRDGQTRTRERDRVMGRHLNTVAQEHGVDLGRLHEIHDGEQLWLQGYLQEIKPTLMDRPSPATQDLRAQAAYRSLLEEAGGRNAEPLGVLQLAPDVSHFDGIDGERGNPWLLPQNTDRIHIGQYFTDSGSGCWGGYIYAPDNALVYFGYLPPKSGVVTFQAWIALHGFYIARADDTCFSCKSAKAYAALWMDVVQNKVLQNGPTYTIVNIDDDNVDTYGFVDKQFQLTMTAPVQSQAPVGIRVGMAVGTMARGGGSYAEVNFKDKAANGDELHYAYIPCVVAYE